MYQTQNDKISFKPIEKTNEITHLVLSYPIRFLSLLMPRKKVQYYKTRTHNGVMAPGGGYSPKKMTGVLVVPFRG